jgi:hypothetical protein
MMNLIIWWLWMLFAIVLLCGGTSILTIVFMQARSYDKQQVRADYVKPKPAPVTPIVVMRREPGATWQIVEDNR